MGQKMKNAPVYFTIAQVRFNPVLTLPTLIPTIQENLRKKNYPDFKESIAVTFNLIPNEESKIPKPVPQQIQQYSFSNLASTESFSLDQGSLSLQATSYETFEVFSARLVEILNLVDRTVGGLSYIDRIGVRYLDAITPGEGETLSQYLIPEVLGIYGKLGGEMRLAFSESQVTYNDETLVARTVIQQGKIAFPPDLQPGGLMLSKRFANFVGPYAILDTDAFSTERMLFDLDEVGKRLSVLHDKTSSAFRSSVTTHALSTWA
jgi:uncharacterized protein (TIGR04255 family)